jgi:hypothetical protein
VVTEKIGIIVISTLVAHQAWHWMAERWQQLRQFPPPTMDANLAGDAIRWLMALVAITIALALVEFVLQRPRWLSAAPNAPGDRAEDGPR